MLKFDFLYRYANYANHYTYMHNQLNKKGFKVI